jgi:DNA repair protein RecO (recombination protein O)
MRGSGNPGRPTAAETLVARATAIAGAELRQRRDDAWVLNTHRLGEADLIVALLTEHGGLIRGVARGARKSRRRFGGALEPLTRVRASWVEREGRELHRIEALDVQRSYAKMQSEPERQAACAVLCEIAGATVHEGQSDPNVFRLVGAVLDALEGGLGPKAAVRYFELWTLRLHGSLPDLAACAGCGRDLRDVARVWGSPGVGVVCSGCRDDAGTRPQLLRRDEREFLTRALQGPPGDVAGLEAAARPGGGLEGLLRGTLQAFVERSLRSYRHLDGTAWAVADRGQDR